MQHGRNASQVIENKYVVMITPELAIAYAQARYTVQVNGREIILPAGGNSDELRDLLCAEDVASCALVTAFNPLGHKTDMAENRRLQHQLVQTAARRWRYYSAAGSDPAGQWPPEPSLLILDIKLEQARELARAYRQNAFLYGEDGRTKLIAVDASQQPLLDV